MFYLAYFFKIFCKSSIRGPLFILMTFMMVMSLQFKQGVKEASENLALKSFIRPYFTVFFDPAVNLDEIRTKISSISLVKEIQEVKTSEGLNAWWSLLKDLNEQNQDISLAFKGLRFVLDQKITSKDSVLVQSFVKKIAGGEDKITSSEVKFPKEEQFLSFHPFFKLLSMAKEWTFIAPIILLWMILFYLNLNELNHHAFILERFQRKQYVASKIIGSGFLFIVVLSFMFFPMAFSYFDVVGLILLGVILLSSWTLTFKGSKWVNKY